jgi:hypothetical protein
MNLELPTPTVTLGPEWAQDLNDALEVVDGHDHSNGFGVKVTPAGLNINQDLDIQTTNRLINAKSTKYADQFSTLAGATNASSTYSTAGDLYFTNGSGVAVQITSGSTVVSVPANIDNFRFDVVNSDLVIMASDIFVYLSIDTSAMRTITLPAASSVTTGRIYIIADDSGLSETNPLTIATSGGDTILGASTLPLTSNFGTWFVISNGTNKWCIV